MVGNVFRVQIEDEVKLNPGVKSDTTASPDSEICLNLTSRAEVDPNLNGIFWQMIIQTTGGAERARVA
jgi:hypothetical protein